MKIFIHFIQLMALYFLLFSSPIVLAAGSVSLKGFQSADLGQIKREFEERPKLKRNLRFLRRVFIKNEDHEVSLYLLGLMHSACRHYASEPPGVFKTRRVFCISGAPGNSIDSEFEKLLKRIVQTRPSSGETVFGKREDWSVVQEKAAEIYRKFYRRKMTSETHPAKMPSAKLKAVATEK